MKNFSYPLVLVAAIYFLQSCSGDSSMLLLDERYQQVNTIVAKADCEDQKGTFTTEVHSSKDGYVFLKQQFDYRRADFIALMETDMGFQLDTNYFQLGPPLPVISRDAVRIYELVKHAVDPSSFIRGLTYEKKEKWRGKQYSKFIGQDNMLNTGTVYYDPKRQVITGLVFRRSRQSTQ